MLAHLGMLSRLPGGPPEWVHAEMRELAALRFRYQEEEEEMEYARRLAISMLQRLEPAECLSGDLLITSWEPELVSSVLGHMTPEHLVAFVSASKVRLRARLRVGWPSSLLPRLGSGLGLGLGGLRLCFQG